MISEHALGAPAAQDLNQMEAQEMAARVREIGSDRSLRVSATNAMQALMKIGEKDVLGAASQGFKAYGMFKNSENLDRLRKQDLLAKASLASAGTTNLSENEFYFLTNPTTYRRLDPSFLSSGEEGKVAAEFEKKTGIKRADFLNMLSSVAETKLYSSDPKLAEKVDAEFSSFLEKIPNAEFRVRVKESLGVIPMIARHKMLSQAVQTAIQMAAKLKPPQVSEEELAKAKAPEAAIANAGRTPAASGGGSTPPPAESTISVTQDLSSSFGEARKLMQPISLSRELPEEKESKNSDLKIENVVGAALQTHSENESIFLRVSRRYLSIQRRGGP